MHTSSAVDGYSLSESFDHPSALTVAEAKAVFAATNFATINALETSPFDFEITDNKDAITTALENADGEAMLVPPALLLQLMR